MLTAMLHMEPKRTLTGLTHTSWPASSLSTCQQEMRMRSSFLAHRRRKKLRYDMWVLRGPMSSGLHTNCAAGKHRRCQRQQKFCCCREIRG